MIKIIDIDDLSYNGRVPGREPVFEDDGGRADVVTAAAATGDDAVIPEVLDGAADAGIDGDPGSG